MIILEKFLVEWLTSDEAYAIRNVAFVVAKCNHKKEWYLEKINECIRPCSLEHALDYLDFLTSNSDLLISRRPYNKYLSRLKNEIRNSKRQLAI